MVRGVQLSVWLLAALLTDEKSLRFTIGAGLIPTLRTPLRGMPGVNGHHAHTGALGFVVEEGTQLRERPAMQPSSTLPTLLIGSFSNLTQFFNHDSCAVC